MTPGRHKMPLRTETALGVLLAVVIGALLAIATVNWMLCSQAEGAALCALLATPLRGNPTQWARRLGRRAAGLVRVLAQRILLRWEETALDNMAAVEASLPVEIQLQRARVGAKRIQLMEAQAIARGEQ